MMEHYPIPLTGLRHFYWAAKLLSFKQAAEAIHVSEAAVSQQIRNLESTLKQKLFKRSHQKVELTEKGRQLFPFVESAFSSLQKGIDSLAEDPNPHRLNLTTVPSLATHWLIRRLSWFNQLHPEISISIDTSISPKNFEDDHLDLAIRYGVGDYPDLKSILLMEDPTVLVCHPDLVKYGEITRDEILRLQMIVGTTDGVQIAMNDFKSFYGFTDDDLKEVLLLRDGALGIEAARTGQGISMQRLSLAVDLLETGELVFAKDFACRRFSFYAVAPEVNFTKPKVAMFVEWLQQEMSKTASQIAPYLNQIKSDR